MQGCHGHAFALAGLHTVSEVLELKCSRVNLLAFTRQHSWYIYVYCCSVQASLVQGGQGSIHAHTGCTN